MAISFVNKGAFIASTGSITPGLPAGLQEGDLCLLFVESANQAISISTQGSISWTQVQNSPQSTGAAATAGGVRLAVYYGWYSSGSTDPTISDSGNHTTGIIMAFRGVDTNNPFDVTPVGLVDSSNTTAISTRSITTTTDNAMIVNGIGLDQDANTNRYTGGANANLADFTVRHYECAGSGLGGGLAVFTGVLTTAGSSGNSTATKTGTGASSTTAYLTMALRPHISQQNLEVEGVASGAAFGAPKLMVNPPPVTEGLLGQWGFDDGSGTVVTDYSGNGNHGTIMATGATWTAKGLTIPTTSYITAPHVDFYTGKQFTFIVACKFAFATNTPTLMGHEDEAQIYLSNNNKAVTFYTASPETELIVSTNNSLVANTDTVIAVTYDNANFKTYYDGSLNRTVAGANKITGGSGNFKFSDDSATHRDNYEFYYALVYDRALTGAEIADIYDFIQSEISSRGGQTVTPGGMASQGVLGAPAITPGNVNLALSGIPPEAAAGALLFAPGNVNLQVTGIAPALVIGTPTLTDGGAKVTPVGLQSGLVIGTPIIAAGTPETQSIQVQGVGSTTSMGALVLAPNSANLQLSGIPSGIRVGAPAVAPGAVVVSLPGIAPVGQLGSPKVTFPFVPLQIALGLLEMPLSLAQSGRARAVSLAEMPLILEWKAINTKLEVK